MTIGKTMTMTSDAELVARLVRQEETALAETYRRHSAAVFGLAAKVTRNRTLAEEIVQEVFLRLWKAPGRYDPARGSLRSFLLAHAHGRSVDLIRSETSRRTREDNQARMVAEKGPSVEEEVIDMQLARTVRSAVETLAPAERAAIELAYFGGHSYREVASLLDEPEGTVKSRIRSGLKRLHGKLDAAAAGVA